VTFESALVLRKVKSNAVNPEINIVIISKETSSARDSMLNTIEN
jgi:hypothetical protein